MLARDICIFSIHFQIFAKLSFGWEFSAKIPDNYGNKSLCLCGQRETMEHIYNCEIWNETENEKIQYNNIYNGNIKKQIRIMKIFEQNLEKQNKRMKIASSHEILIESTVDPIVMG